MKERASQTLHKQNKKIFLRRCKLGRVPEIRPLSTLEAKLDSFSHEHKDGGNKRKKTATQNEKECNYCKKAGCWHHMHPVLQMLAARAPRIQVPAACVCVCLLLQDLVQSWSLPHRSKLGNSKKVHNFEVPKKFRGQTPRQPN